jgi:hypothetical protein
LAHDPKDCRQTACIGDWNFTPARMAIETPELGGDLSNSSQPPNAYSALSFQGLRPPNYA